MHSITLLSYNLITSRLPGPLRENDDTVGGVAA